MLKFNKSQAQLDRLFDDNASPMPGPLTAQQEITLGAYPSMITPSSNQRKKEEEELKKTKITPYGLSLKSLWGLSLLIYKKETKTLL